MGSSGLPIKKRQLETNMRIAKVPKVVHSLSLMFRLNLEKMQENENRKQVMRIEKEVKKERPVQMNEIDLKVDDNDNLQEEEKNFPVDENEQLEDVDNKSALPVSMKNYNISK